MEKDLKEIVTETIIGICEELNDHLGMEMDNCDEDSLGELNNEELIGALVQIVEIITERRIEAEYLADEDDEDEESWKDELFGEESWGENKED